MFARPALTPPDSPHNMTKRQVMESAIDFVYVQPHYRRQSPRRRRRRSQNPRRRLQNAAGATRLRTVPRCPGGPDSRRQSRAGARRTTRLNRRDTTKAQSSRTPPQGEFAFEAESPVQATMIAHVFSGFMPARREFVSRQYERLFVVRQNSRNCRI